MNQSHLLSAAMVVCVCAGQLFAQTTRPKIPANGDNNGAAAIAALKASTRHGEYVDLAIPGSQTKLKTWVVYPERREKAPVVIVIHEIFGLSDWVRGVADQLAAEGYIALAPDMLSGMGPNGGGTESLGSNVTATIRNLTAEDQVKRYDVVREYAIALPAASQKVGCIGFCWGGTASFLYATKQPKLNAAVVYYGTGPMANNVPDKAQLEKIACPVLGCYGGNDARVTSTVDPTKAVMTELKKPYETYVYEGAGHGFLRQHNSPANIKASEEAWAATIAFFKKNLE